jgi:hypothetical protein
MTTAALARPEPADLPMLSTAQVLHRLDGINDLMSKAMVPTVDYGSIPGTQGKPTLLKPGAEKLCVLFQFAPAYKTDKTYHADGHLTVECVCTIFHAPSSNRLGEAAAMCSTRESKYAYRGGARVCPECGKPCIKKSKFPPRDDPDGQPGFYCYGKIGGCGVNYAADDERITSQPEGRVPNPDLADCYNTVLRIAEKRALVAAVRLVTGASAIFDEEQAEREDVPPDAREEHHSPQREPAPAKPAAPAADPRMPKTGVELLTRLNDYEAKLVEQGICQPGDLIRHVAEAGLAAGFPKDFRQWTPPAFALAAKETRVFERAARKATADARTPTLQQMKDEIEELTVKLKYDSMQLTLAEQACNIDDPAAIDAVQAAKLVTLLRHELKGQVPV